MKNYIEDFKRIPIQDVGSRLGMDLTKTGNSLQGDCPTGHPSSNHHCFSINTDQNYFHCFNCGVAGDVIRLVEIVNETDFKGAVSWLGKEFNVHVPESIEDKNRHDDAYYSRAAIYEEIYRFGKYLLYESDGGEARQYLFQHRGYSSEKQLRQTEWIFFPPDFRLQLHLREKFPEFSDKIRKLHFGSFVEEPYWAAFPYRDRDGRITGFVWRALDPKGYILTNKSNGLIATGVRYHSTFQTSKHDLFNLNKCKGQDTILIVEGYPDAMLFPTLGLENVTAVGQGKLAKSHLEGLNEHGVRNVIISFDNDPPKEDGYRTGIENTSDAVKLLLTESRINPFVIDPMLLDEHKDPDEFVRANGIDTYRMLIERSESGAKWMARMTMSKYNILMAMERQQAIDEISTISTQIKSRIAIDDLISEAARSLGIDVDALKEEIGSYHERLARAALAEKYKKLIGTADELRRSGNLESLTKLFDAETIELKNEFYKTKIQPVESLAARLRQKHEFESNRTAEFLGYRLNNFPTISRNIDGLQPGLYIIGAETNIGKTAMLTNMALDVIESNPDVNVLYFSLDDNWNVIANRFVGILTGLPLNQLQRKQTLETDALKIKVAYDKLCQLADSGRLHIRDLSEVSDYAQAEAVIRELCDGGNLVVFLDGLYNLEVETNGSIREENIERAKALKSIVDVYQIPIICTAELRKKAKEDGLNKKPTVSDIMETGKFGYNGTVVWLLSTNYKESKENDEIELILDYGKNKAGGYKGYQPLTFIKDKGIVKEGDPIVNQFINNLKTGADIDIFE